MTTITFAPIREQGAEFVAVIVKDHIVTSSHQGDETIAGLQPQFGRPVVLMGERNGRWYGRRDLAEFMSRVHPSRIRWRQGTYH
jgi:hypothetical protein